VEVGENKAQSGGDVRKERAQGVDLEEPDELLSGLILGPDTDPLDRWCEPRRKHKMAQRKRSSISIHHARETRRLPTGDEAADAGRELESDDADATQPEPAVHPARDDFGGHVGGEEGNEGRVLGDCVGGHRGGRQDGEKRKESRVHHLAERHASYHVRGRVRLEAPGYCGVMVMVVVVGGRG